MEPRSRGWGVGFGILLGMRGGGGGGIMTFDAVSHLGSSIEILSCLVNDKLVPLNRLRCKLLETSGVTPDNH